MNINFEDIADFRRELHRFPEVSGKEFETQNRIIQRLESMGTNASTIGETGVFSVFEGLEPGATVLLRADIDALPIQEVNEFPHKSLKKGISHKCGHDGHTAILIGVAQSLIQTPIRKGKVILLFQPAEENGKGAKKVLEDTKFTFTPDYVFAFHNLPGYPLHQIVVKEGSFNAAVKSIILKLEGKTSHAAEPEHGINPALAISKMIQFFDQLTVVNDSRIDFTLLTPVYSMMGERSYGINAGYGELHYTLRCWDQDNMEKLTNRIVQGANEIAKSYNLSLTIEWTEEFAASHNDGKSVKLISEVAAINNYQVNEKTIPFKWGEDFGLYTQKFKGAMFGIGSGEECPALHNPDYDFPDEIIPTGIHMFNQLIQQIAD